MNFKIDWLLLLSILVINLVGLVIIFSLDSSLLCSQALFMAIGLISYFVISRIDISIFNRFHAIFYVTSLSLLIINFLLGQATRGSVRWIKIAGLNFQASEFVKPLLILFFARLALKLNFQKIKDVGKFMLFLILPTVLIFKQPDLGNALVLLVIGITILFAANIKWRYILLASLLFIILLPLVWHGLRPYQQQRIQTFLNPSWDPLGSGYHSLQAMISVGSGKLTGKGLGVGTQSILKFLPENHTDFIFASFSEAFGWLGSTILLLIYLGMFLYILKIISRCSNKFSQLCCLGVFSMIVFQTLVNIGMNLGIVPITGITLPLFSFGGSSLVSTYIALGFVQAAANLAKGNSVIEIG